MESSVQWLWRPLYQNQRGWMPQGAAMKYSTSDIARVLLEAGAVVLQPEQPFRFASGLLSPIYCDNRLLLGQVAARRTVAEALSHLVLGEVVSAEVVAGTATAGIPWAAWVAEALTLPMAYVRSG